MKKQEFINLGLDDELAGKCEAASLEELKGYIPKARFDEVNNEKKKLELDVKERDNQLETLKNSTGDVEALKKQIETLQADNKAKDDEHAAEIKQLKINSAVESAITGAKGKNSKAIKALLDLENAELNEDGTVKGLKEQLDKLIKAEDSKFLFDDGVPKFRGVVPASGRSQSTPGAVTKEAFNRMGYKDRLKLFTDDKATYDALMSE